MDEEKIKELYKIIDEVFAKEDFDKIKSKVLLKRKIRRALVF